MTEHTDPNDSRDAHGLLDNVPMERRSFLRKAALGAAVVPVVASFSMTGMGAAYAATAGVSGTTTTTSTTSTTATSTSTTTTTTAPNQLALCAQNGPYGFTNFSYGPNQSPETVRPDLFAPNGVCDQLRVSAWWRIG
jgi:hypothetical protein